MSHELRTPLNAIIGYASLLAVEPLIASKGLVLEVELPPLPCPLETDVTKLRLGGEITVASAPRRGSSFTVRLPRMPNVVSPGVGLEGGGARADDTARSQLV